MWIKHYNYRDIPFDLIGDWFGLDGFKVCLSVGTERVQEALAIRPDDVIEGFKHFRDNAEELMLVGWAGDWMFWDRGAHGEIAEWKRVLEILSHSRFADSDVKLRAAQTLESVQRKAATATAKKEYTRQRRSAFSDIQAQMVLALIDRDGYVCQECGAVEDLTIDHVIPLSKGGSDDLENLRLLCRRCNSSKGDRTP